MERTRTDTIPSEDGADRVNTVERLLDVCNRVVTTIRDAWKDCDPQAVQRNWLPDYDAKTLTSRRVSVYPVSANQALRDSRGTVFNEYQIAVIVADKYALPGDPSDEWLDATAVFVGQIFDRLSDETVDPIFTGITKGTMWPESAEITAVYDVDRLRQDKLYVAEFVITYQEILE